MSHLECGRCGKRHDADVPQNLCSCGRPLLARYDLARVAASPADIAARPPSLWRYRELLPVRDLRHVVTLGEGMTPMVPIPRTGQRVGLPRLLVKDEGLLPTGSFKARGAAVGVSRARELGIERITMPTNGNAGAAWAAYAARAGMRALVVAPAQAPAFTLAEAVLAGARVHVVDGLIADAGRLAAQAVDRGWFSAATLREPYRIEGKKTLGLELAMQLGWTLPAAIIYPTGGGTGLIGMWKAFIELRNAGWIEGALPRMYTVQSTGCAPVVRAFAAGAEQCEPWLEPETVASGLRVPGPLGGRIMLRVLRESGGGAVAVEDAALEREARAATGEEGIDFSPEGGAALAAARTLLQRGELGRGDRVVAFNTGAGWLYRDPGGLPPV